jgi:hypothetical protein
MIPTILKQMKYTNYVCSLLWQCKANNNQLLLWLSCLHTDTSKKDVSLQLY